MASDKLEKLLDAFQGNAYPAMLEDLGNHLGVTADSLRRLALGWAPIVTFKKGPSFIGWWAIPERDADANPVGISLRSQSDLKVMYPGSKHGLIYEVNPNHTRGERGYSPGADNWIRTMDAGHPCPVCQKPDGCLLSAEDPANPKAVVCIRVKENAKKPLKFGYLHVLKDEGNLTGRAALADNGGPVVIVEGMSDTAAALDLGFDAVGRPSNLAGLDALNDLIRGRECIIIGENDAKLNKLTNTTETPGRDGMIATFQTVRRAAKRVTMLMPPPHVKDLRAWVAKYKLTKAQFLEYHETHKEEQAAEVVIGDDRPLTIARTYLMNKYRLVGRYTLRRWQGGWYEYVGGKYRPITDEEAASPMYDWSEDKMVQAINNKGDIKLTPLSLNNSTVANVFSAIASQTLIADDQLPTWINNAIGPDPSHIVCFNNGVLDVPAFLDGSNDALLEPTPDLFTTAVIPFPFDPTASCPQWLAFLESSLGDEQEKIDLLQEWFGYCMTPDTTQQKMMFFRGPSGAGKSVTLNVLGAMIGREHTATTSFASLASNFGSQSLVGKLVCLVPDARTPKGDSLNRGLELLLNVASGDPIQIDRKFRDPLAHHKVMARVTIASNEFLDLPDHAGAMARRLNIIQFSRSFIGKEDRRLEAKLKQEIPGIALWALTGLRRLRDNGSFTVPASSQGALQDWRITTSPMASFLQEATETGENYQVGQQELFDAFSKWSSERRITPISPTRFRERLFTNAPYVTQNAEIKGGHKFTVYIGLRLQPWAARQFLGKP